MSLAGTAETVVVPAPLTAPPPAPPPFYSCLMYSVETRWTNLSVQLSQVAWDTDGLADTTNWQVKISRDGLWALEMSYQFAVSVTAWPANSTLSVVLYMYITSSTKSAGVRGKDSIANYVLECQIGEQQIKDAIGGTGLGTSTPFTLHGRYEANLLAGQAVQIDVINNLAISTTVPTILPNAGWKTSGPPVCYLSATYMGTG